MLNINGARTSSLFPYLVPYLKSKVGMKYIGAVKIYFNANSTVGIGRWQNLHFPSPFTMITIL